MKIKRPPCKFIKVPDRIRIIAGRHKGMIGNVWTSLKNNRVEITTSNGFYFAESLKDIDILSMRRRLVLK